MKQFNVQGMTCGHCVRSVTQAVQSSDPAATVQVDLSKGLVQVDSRLTDDEVLGLIRAAGYMATAM